MTRNPAAPSGSNVQEIAVSPKQKYDERKRLRLENDLRTEQRRKGDLDRADEMDAAILRFFATLERLADATELWADQQTDALRQQESRTS